MLDLALCVDTSGAGDGWAKARTMQAKMSSTRVHVEERIKELTNLLVPPTLSSGSNTPPSRPPPPSGALPCYDAPPSYQQSQATAGLNVEAELMELGEEGQAVALPRSGTSKSLTEKGELLFTMEGVQVFHVSASGEVTTPSYPEALHLVKGWRSGSKRRRISIDEFARTDNRGRAPAFIEVGQWTYPLVRGQSPILRSEYTNCYMFPDLDSGVTGGAVGLLLPPEVAQTDREIFEGLMAELTSSFKTQEEVDKQYQEYKEFSSNLANGLVKGSEVLGRGMVKGAVKGSELIFRGTDYVKQYITPEQQAREVDPKIKQGLEMAAWVSKGACRVSGWMVGKVGQATMALGRMAAPHLESGANRALTNMTNQSSHESSNQLKIVGEVASGTVAAVSTMYMALENSSKILAKNIANNTVMIVSHKYGTDMAAVTDSALSTAGNSYLTFYNAAALGPKGIAKRAAKDTGKAFIGVDQEEVNARARVVPDQNLGIEDVVDSVKGTPGPKG